MQRVFIPAKAGIQRRLFLAADARRSSARPILVRERAGLHKLFFLAALAVAALLPAYQSRGGAASTASKPQAATDWPATFEGKPLTELPLSPVEKRFAAQFPGRIGRFTDGSRNIILRVVDQPTRLLHPATDCFRGTGYAIDHPRVREGADGKAWSCFAAERDGRRRTVCERIYDGEDGAWTDVSAWYWSAALGRSQGPWWAVTVASAP